MSIGASALVVVGSSSFDRAEEEGKGEDASAALGAGIKDGGGGSGLVGGRLSKPSYIVQRRCK